MRIKFNYLTSEKDRLEWLKLIRITRKIMNQPAFTEYNGGEASPGASVESDQEILEWVGKDAETALHPSCTCRTGTDGSVVIDPNELKVHGIENLRVIDASVMPYITNGNIYAPVMMIVEKTADVILGNTPLAPSKAPYYKHTSKYTKTPKVTGLDYREFPILKDSLKITRLSCLLI